MFINKLYDKIIRNSKEAEKQYVSMATNPIVYKAEKLKESPITDEAFKEQLERVLRDNVLDVDIRITGDTVIGAKINPEDKGLFLRSLSDEAILKECKERGLDVKYSGEENLAYRLNWVMQDYYKAGEDEEEREHRVKCYKLFWDALEDSEFFNRLESHKEELTKLQEKCKKFVEKQNEQKHEDTMDEFTQNIRNLITDKLTVHTKGLDGSEVSSTVFIDDKTAKDIASGIRFYVGKEAIKNSNREIPEWSEEDEKILNSVMWHVSFSVSNGTNDGIIKCELTDWLKSLHERFNLQPKQEWSEEDRHAIKNCEYAIKETFKDEQNPHRIGTLDWLKSLRPSWKPSDRPVWRIWKNGACGNSEGNPIALVKTYGGYKLVSCLGADGEKYIMLSDLEKLPGFNEK